MELSEVALICKALSDRNRLQIIHFLTCGEQCACELLERMKITQPTLSHHMKVLENCRLVVSRRKGKWSHYSLNADRWAAFRGYIGSVRETGGERDGRRAVCPGQSSVHGILPEDGRERG